MLPVRRPVFQRSPETPFISFINDSCSIINDRIGDIQISNCPTAAEKDRKPVPDDWE